MAFILRIMRKVWALKQFWKTTKLPFDLTKWQLLVYNVLSDLLQVLLFSTTNLQLSRIPPQSVIS